MSVIERKVLLQSLELRISGFKREKVIWVYQSIEKPLMRSFYVDELSTDVSVPMQCSILETLKIKFKQGDTIIQDFIPSLLLNHTEEHAGLLNLSENQGRKNILSEDKILQSRVHSLSALLVQQLMGFEIKELYHMIEARFCKLIIMDQEQTIEFCSKSDCQQGKFATMIVTIPVESGFKGGRINIIHNQKRESFDFDKDSDKLSSLVGFYSDCFHEFERVTDGSMVVMVFNVIWKWRREEKAFPLEFPAFLKAFSEVKNQLKSWTFPPQYHEKKPEISLSTNLDGAKNLLPISDQTSCGNQEKISVLSCVIEHSAGTKKLLFFPLYEKYKNELSFTQLRGRDRQIVHLFRSINFLDVHLAEVTQVMDSKLDYHIVDWENSPDLDERVFKICRWIGSTHSLPLSNQIELDVRTQLIGEIRHIHSATMESDTQIKYYHYVLVIQPRHEAVNHACRYELDALLNYLKSQLLPNKSSAVYNPIQYVRQQKHTLKQVISFCRGAPGVLSWTEPWSARNERSVGLIEICTKMQAKKEGHQLLELLCGEISSSPDTSNDQSDLLPEESPENIVKLTGAIAEFVSKVGGWKTCGELVLQFISPALVTRKLGYYTSLSYKLLIGNCIEGAFSVAESISSIIDNLNNRHTNCLTNNQIVSLVHLVFNLERTKANQLNRLIISPITCITSIATLFSRLELRRHCSLVVDIQKLDGIFNFKDIQSCRQLFLDIHKSLAFNDAFDSSCFSFQIVALPLFKTFISLGDKDSTRRLIHKICFGHRVYNEKFIVSNDILLLDSMLLYSYEIFYLILLSDLGKAAFKILRDCGIRQLAHVAFYPQVPTYAPEEVSLIPASSIFLNTTVDDLVQCWIIGMRKHLGFCSSADALENGISLTSDTVCMIVDTLMECWIRGICNHVGMLYSITVQNVFPLSITSSSWQQIVKLLVQIHNEISACVQVFIRNEKGKYSHSPVVINELFSPLVDAWRIYVQSQGLEIVKTMKSVSLDESASYDSSEPNVFATKMEDVNILLHSIFQQTSSE